MAANNEKVEITKTELRSLMFWAKNGIEKSTGGSYRGALDYIRSNYAMMPKHLHSDCKRLEFGSRVKKNTYL